MSFSFTMNKQTKNERDDATIFIIKPSNYITLHPGNPIPSNSIMMSTRTMTMVI